MPIYKFETPDGKIMKIEGSRRPTKEEVAEIYRRNNAKKQGAADQAIDAVAGKATQVTDRMAGTGTTPQDTTGTEDRGRNPFFLPDPAAAVLVGGLSGATFGASDWLHDNVGRRIDPSMKKSAAEIKAQAPLMSLGGNVASMFMPGGAATGLAKGIQKIPVFAKFAQRGVGTLTQRLGSRVGAGMLEGATEEGITTAFQGGDAKEVFNRAKSGAMFGGGFAGLGTALGAILGRRGKVGTSMAMRQDADKGVRLGELGMSDPSNVPDLGSVEQVRNALRSELSSYQRSVIANVAKYSGAKRMHDLLQVGFANAANPRNPTPVDLVIAESAPKILQKFDDIVSETGERLRGAISRSTNEGQKVDITGLKNKWDDILEGTFGLRPSVTATVTGGTRGGQGIGAALGDAGVPRAQAPRGQGISSSLGDASIPRKQAPTPPVTGGSNVSVTRELKPIGPTSAVPSDIKLVQQIDDIIRKHGNEITPQQAVILRQALDNIADTKLKLLTGTTEKAVQKAIGKLRQINKQQIGEEFANANDEMAEAMKLRQALNMAVGENAPSGMSRAASFMLAVASINSAGGVNARKLLRKAQEATGVDIVSEAQAARAALELTNPEAAKRLASEIAEAGGRFRFGPFQGLLGLAGLARKTLKADPVDDAMRLARQVETPPKLNYLTGLSAPLFGAGGGIFSRGFARPMPEREERKPIRDASGQIVSTFSRTPPSR